MRRLFSILVGLLVYTAVVGATTHTAASVSRKSFPKGFVFGTATSAYQVEGMASKGGRGPSIWDEFIKTPGLVPDNATGEVTVDQYHRYKEDIDMMANLNFDAYRFSISWSRVFPNGTGKVNKEGVAYYNRLINYMLHKGITPYANLNHYDLPLAIEEKYLGWLSHDVVKDFANYAEFCFKTFGDRAYGNCTAGNSATEPYIVAHNLILSHAAAVQRYREKYQEKQKGRIGILLDFTWYEPLTRSKADNLAAQRARDFHVGWFLHPIVYGEYPKTMQNIVKDRLPKFTIEEVKMVKGSFDLIGINQYTAHYIYDPHTNPPKHIGYQMDWNARSANKRKGVPIGPRAYSYWLYNVPWGLYKAVMYIKERYGNPTVILAENGMDDPGNITFTKGLHDTTRINYYKSYLAALKQSVDEGANVIGYFAWSLLDNFEWRSGYTSRFGIVYVDFKTLKRYPKMSAYWFKKILRKN
ncbi:beta-glucosidase 44-like protein [Tanacetum coccineum]|uniref:Beta-glucosidase 44-like protein n=1 Tax=Tanacetum coccineum TaxID=301880 RepID=A0ABQ5DF57_9ASTR